MSSSEPQTKNEAVSQVHTALDTVESAFKNAFGGLSAKVKTLLGHLHNQADGVATAVEGDLGQDVGEVKQDMSKAYDAVPVDGATGQGATGGGSNPNAAPITVDNPTGKP